MNLWKRSPFANMSSLCRVAKSKQTNRQMIKIVIWEISVSEFLHGYHNKFLFKEWGSWKAYLRLCSKSSLTFETASNWPADAKVTWGLLWCLVSDFSFYKPYFLVKIMKVKIEILDWKFQRCFMLLKEEINLLSTRKIKSTLECHMWHS